MPLSSPSSLFWSSFSFSLAFSSTMLTESRFPRVRNRNIQSARRDRRGRQLARGLSPFSSFVFPYAGANVEKKKRCADFPGLAVFLHPSPPPSFLVLRSSFQLFRAFLFTCFCTCSSRGIEMQSARRNGEKKRWTHHRNDHRDARLVAVSALHMPSRAASPVDGGAFLEVGDFTSFPTDSDLFLGFKGTQSSFWYLIAP